MIKRLISVLLIFLMVLTIYGSFFLEEAYGKTCEEALDQCMELYLFNGFWGFVIGTSYCNLGYVWCLKYFKE